MPLWNKTNTAPKWVDANKGSGKRNLIITAKGWVRRQVKTDVQGNVRVQDQVIVPMEKAANAAGRPIITDMWHSVATIAHNSVVNTWISFSQPITSTATLKITVANTNSTGTATTGIANTTVYGTNKILFRWTPSSAGTYKIQAQTIANGTATAANVRSANAGNTVCLRVIQGATSNTAGVVTAT